MRIKCGNHGWNSGVRHDTAFEVKLCYAGKLDDHKFIDDWEAEREVEDASWGQKREPIDEDGSQAYALMLERRAERGNWFGSGE